MNENNVSADKRKNSLTFWSGMLFPLQKRNTPRYSSTDSPDRRDGYNSDSTL